MPTDSLKNVPVPARNWMLAFYCFGAMIVNFFVPEIGPAGWFLLGLVALGMRGK